MATIAKSLATKITMNDGVHIPLFGLGTYQIGSDNDKTNIVSCVKYALEHGYRLVDTATVYRNEREVGEGIKQSGVKREDVFIVTKVWADDHGFSACQKAFADSLNRLDCGYLDLYLIHAPIADKVLETYDAMLDLKKQGLIRSVGVSNFGIHHLEALSKAGRPAPSVNQIELHPFQRRDDVVAYCRMHGITVMGYSPLAHAKKNDDSDICQMAARYGKTFGQTMIRWSVQKGYITIPKSSQLDRIIENTNVFDWELSQQDMQILDNLPPFSLIGTTHLFNGKAIKDYGVY